MIQKLNNRCANINFKMVLKSMPKVIRDKNLMALYNQPLLHLPFIRREMEFGRNYGIGIINPLLLKERCRGGCFTCTTPKSTKFYNSLS